MPSPLSVPVSPISSGFGEWAVPGQGAVPFQRVIGGVGIEGESRRGYRAGDEDFHKVLAVHGTENDGIRRQRLVGQRRNNASV